jgi:hypothetical protein
MANLSTISYYILKQSHHFDNRVIGVHIPLEKFKHYSEAFVQLFELVSIEQQWFLSDHQLELIRFGDKDFRNVFDSDFAYNLSAGLAHLDQIFVGKHKVDGFVFNGVDIDRNQEDYTVEIFC